MDKEGTVVLIGAKSFLLWAFAKEIEPATKANKKKILNLML